MEAPRIARHAWGRVELDDGRVFKDVKLYPGGAREWDWRETGTRHEPGIQPADVRELLDAGADVIVLSSGYYERLKTRPETLDLIRGRNAEARVLQTGEAVAAYNAARADRPAAALIHSTC